MPDLHYPAAVAALKQGGIIAYPTEAVFGLGCDPNNLAAVEKLLALKQRDWQKGLILIAADFSQLQPFVAIDEGSLPAAVSASWPGAATWLLPAKPSVSPMLRGRYNTLAVRITAHPVAAGICNKFGGAIISTSANKAGASPSKTCAQTNAHWADRIDAVVAGEVGDLTAPTPIKDAKTGQIIR